jgi:hypothetical protein
MTIAGMVAYPLLMAAGEAKADDYAQEHVARLVIQYMEWHGGSWPRSWDDLQEPFEASLGPGGNPSYRVWSLLCRESCSFPRIGLALICGSSN